MTIGEMVSRRDFTTSFTIDRTPDEVFEAIINVRGWWLGEIEGGTTAIGDEFTYRYQDMHRCTLRLTEVVPGKKITWLVLDNYFDFAEDPTEWQGTEIRFEIIAVGGRTELRFTHAGLSPELECYDVCSNAWGSVIYSNLRTLAESGTPQPRYGIKNEIGKYGIWGEYEIFTPDGLRELENLGYDTAWLGSLPPSKFSVIESLLSATDSMRIGTSITNILFTPAEPIAESFHRIDDQFPGRFILGLGAGHSEQSDTYRPYVKPYDAMVEFLDELDDAGVPREHRALAALGPRMLKLARDRSLGALPFLVTAEHTRRAREILGPDALLVPGQKVVVDPDPVRARTTARPFLEFYLGLQNYLANLRRIGFSEADLTPPGTDHFIDSLAAHGTPRQVADVLDAHIAAGADQVAIQVASSDHLAALRAMAPILTADHRAAL